MHYFCIHLHQQHTNLDGRGVLCGELRPDSGVCQYAGASLCETESRCKPVHRVRIKQPAFAEMTDMVSHHWCSAIRKACNIKRHQQSYPWSQDPLADTRWPSVARQADGNNADRIICAAALCIGCRLRCIRAMIVTPKLSWREL